MLRRLSFVFAFLWFVVLGGSAFAANPFAGSWVGDWNGGGQRGRIYATISGAGTVSGFVINSSAGDWGDLAGSVNNIGIVALSVNYTNMAPQSWSGKTTFARGNIRLSAIVPSTGGRISSTLRRDPFNLAEQAPENAVGEWSGVWQSGRQSGTFQFTVNPNGSVTGETVSDVGPNGVLSGSVTPQGDFFGSIEYPGGIVEPIVSKFVPAGLRLSAPFTQRKNGSTPVRGSFTLKSGPLPELGNDPRRLGRWSGSWRTPTESGSMVVIFQANGVISGSIRKAGSPIVGAINGQAIGIGSFMANITFVVPGQGIIVTPLTGSVSAAGSRLIGAFSIDGVAGDLNLQKR